VLRDGLSRDLIEDRTNVAADVSLQGRGQALVKLCPGHLV